MGKKRIITTQGDAPNSEEQSVSSVKKSSKKNVINGTAYINVSYNNTLVSITDSKGDAIAWSSAGLLGFKGTKKSTPYAANLVAKDCAEKAKKFNLVNIYPVYTSNTPYPFLWRELLYFREKTTYAKPPLFF